jgi:hypothetical protein
MLPRFDIIATELSSGIEFAESGGWEADSADYSK